MSASKETGSLPVSRTASPAPSEEDRVGPPSSTGKAHWTGLFRQAVSSMEQHIDRVLDTPTSRPSSATSVPDRSSPAPIEPAESSDTRLARRLEATVRQSLNRRIPDDNVSDTASKSQQPQQRSSSASSNSVKLESDTEQNETEKNDITTDETAASDDMESQMENTSSTMEDEEKESATLNNDIEVTTITDTEHKSSSETAQDDKETKQSLDSISRQHSDTVDDDTIVTTNDQSPATTSNDDHINDTNDEENIWLRDRIRALESQIESQKETAERVLSQQRVIDEQTQQLAQKNEQIAGLLKEGESLAKRELKSNSTVKKLQTQLKEVERKNSTLERQLASSKEEITKLTQKFTQSNDAEKRMSEQLKKLRQGYEQLIKKRNKLEAENTELTNNQQVLQASIESLQDEVKREQERGQNIQVQLNDEALVKEKSKAEHLEQQLSSVNKEYEEEKSRMNNEITSLRNALKTAENDINEHEETLRDEIRRLRKRAEEAEARVDELLTSHDDTSARELQQELETLRVQHTDSLQLWKRQEEELRNSTGRLERQYTNEQNQKMNLQKKVEEMTAELNRRKDKEMEYVNKINELTGNNKEYASNKQQLEARIAQLEEKMAREKQKYESQSSRLASKSTEQSSERKTPSIRRSDGSVTKDENDVAPIVPQSISNNSSENIISCVTQPVNEEMEHERRASISTSLSNSRQSIDSVRSTGTDLPAANTRRLEGQVISLQAKLQQITRSREEMLDQLVEMTRRAERLDDTLASLETIEADRSKLRDDYEAAQLQLKTQAVEINELKTDMTEMKEVYRQQVSSLINKIEEYSRMNSTVIGGST